VLRIANCSAFYGDRFEAAREMVEGGPVDVLTGDYLAELTMAILARQQARDPARGYARTFVRQLEEIAVTCRERGIRIVVNAGGLAPAACAEACRAVYRRLGLDARVAHLEGDDLRPRLEALRGALSHRHTGAPLDPSAAPVLTANAYLGGWGIAEALARGAELVICPRVTDASLVLGPAAEHFGWARDDWDRLAAAVVAGHVIECGPQCTGGNYAFFDEVPGLERPGFPLVEMHADGSFVVTKHPGTGGRVSRGTVTAQLLYEIAGPRYLNPDVTARFDTIALADDGPDRVRVSGVRGEPPPATTKVTLHRQIGWTNRVRFVIPGPNVEAKAALAERTLWHRLGGKARFEETAASLRGGEGWGLLTVAVAHRDPAVVGRAFSNRAVEMSTASYPGMTLTEPPGEARPRLALWPAALGRDRLAPRVVLEGGETVPLATGPAARPGAAEPEPTAAAAPEAGEPGEPGEPGEREARTTAAAPAAATGAASGADEGPAPGADPTPTSAAERATAQRATAQRATAQRATAHRATAHRATAAAPEPTREAPLGAVVGARSGDKGGDANVGVWVRDPAAWDWLLATLTVERLRACLPEIDALPVERHSLPNLHAVSFVVRGLLGDGVAASLRDDPQAKTLAETLRAAVVPIPERLLGG
jgi:hypothetical protein